MDGSQRADSGAAQWIAQSSFRRPLPSLKPSKSWSPETWKSIESTTAWQEHPAILRNRQPSAVREAAKVQLAAKAPATIHPWPGSHPDRFHRQHGWLRSWRGSPDGERHVQSTHLEKKNRAAVAQAQLRRAAARHAWMRKAISSMLRGEAHFALSDALRREALHEDTSDRWPKVLCRWPSRLITRSKHLSGVDRCANCSWISNSLYCVRRPIKHWRMPP